MEQFMVDGICSDMSQPRKQQQHDINQPFPYQYQHHLHQHQQQQQQQQQQYYHHHHHHLIHPYPLHHLPHFQQEEDFSTPTPPPEQQLVHQQMFVPLPAVHDFHYHHHPIPITHQLFQQTHQFHLFHQEQQRRQQNTHQLDLHIDPQTSPEKSTSPPRIGVGNSGGGGGIPAFLAPSMNFSLSVNEKSTGAGCNNDDAILQQSDEVDGSDSHWPHPPTSSREDNHVAIKEPFWRPLDLDTDYKEKNLHHHRQTEMEEDGKTTSYHEERTEEAGSNYKLFSELEAICKTTGSSSALTGENPPPPTLVPGLISPVEDIRPEDGGDDIDHHLSSSSRELKGRRRRKKRKRRKKRRIKEQLNSIVIFFETLVKELVDRQEILHGKFFEVLEKRDSERMAMESMWREEEARNSTREAKAKEQEHAMAAAREGAILSFLEKISRENFINENNNINNEEEEEEENESDDDDDNNNNNHEDDGK